MPSVCQRLLEGVDVGITAADDVSGSVSWEISMMIYESIVWM